MGLELALPTSLHSTSGASNEDLGQPEGQEAVPGVFFSLGVAWFSHLQDLIIHFAWI